MLTTLQNHKNLSGFQNNSQRCVTTLQTGRKERWVHISGISCNQNIYIVKRKCSMREKKKTPLKCCQKGCETTWVICPALLTPMHRWGDPQPNMIFFFRKMSHLSIQQPVFISSSSLLLSSLFFLLISNSFFAFSSKLPPTESNKWFGLKVKKYSATPQLTAFAHSSSFLKR